MTSLAAVCAYFNPCRYLARRRNYDKFRRYMDASQTDLLTVELIFDPDLPSELGNYDNVLCVRGGDIMWQKERLLQIGIDALLAAGHGAIVWIDADMVFDKRSWARNVLTTLESFDAVQSFDQLVSHYPGRQLIRPSVAKDRTSFAHGGSWAATSDFWSRVSLYQHCVVGGADSLMAQVFLQSGQDNQEDFQWPSDNAIMNQMNATMREHATAWARKSFGDYRVGFVADQTAHLLSHGSRRRRYYLQRWQALEDFDPGRDVGVGDSGALYWTTDKPKLHQSVRKYFWARREDDQ